jgi:Holliday junction resolvase RusA-like endonuclease
MSAPVGASATDKPQTFDLPWPISTNAMWRAVRVGDHATNILTAKAREWKEAAADVLWLQRPQSVRGQVELLITLVSPTRRRFDLDNRAKIVLDLLVACGVIEADDSSIVREVRIAIGDHAAGARVTVTPVGWL